MSRHLVIVFAFVLTFSTPSIAWTCQGCKDVFDNFKQCAGFIEGRSANPTLTCCHNVANLNSIVKREKGGLMRICKCVEYFATYKTHHHPFIPSRIQDLPLKCNTHLSFPISEHMDCSRYSLSPFLSHILCMNEFACKVKN